MVPYFLDMEFFIRFILVLLNIVAIIIEPIIVWLNGEEKKRIPATKNALLGLSANEAISRIRQGKVSRLTIFVLEICEKNNLFMK